MTTTMSMTMSYSQSSHSPSVLATLETIDVKPLPPSEKIPPIDITYNPELPRRVSRLPPHPTIPSIAGPSRGPQRYLYVAVRRGHCSGVFSSWAEAERHVIDHPSPVFKTFSTRLAAEAFVSGWNGAGRHSLPSSSPRPLREHLAMNFPSSVPLPQSSPNRPSYHARLLTAQAPDSVWSDDFAPRPHLKHQSRSYRHSLVKVSSPLRTEVNDDDHDTPKPTLRKVTSMIGAGGLLSPPASPEDKPHPPPAQGSSVMDRERPLRPRSLAEASPWSSNTHRQFAGIGMGIGLRPMSPPASPPTSPERGGRPAAPPRKPSGLWADSKPITPSSMSPSPSPTPLPETDLVSNAPKFSRSGLKKNSVVMPVAAPKPTNSSALSLSLSRRTSRSSAMISPSPSLTSLNSASSTPTSGRTIRRQSSYFSSSSQDRLASLAETSKKELQLNEEGLLALDSLSPPRPAFMRQSSNSSLSSMSSLTSATSSAPTSSLDSCEPIEEEEALQHVQVTNVDDVQISCTKSDADADGSVESSSMKSGGGGDKGKKKGGLFKRLTKVLKLEKKDVHGQEKGRRGSL